MTILYVTLPRHTYPTVRKVHQDPYGIAMSKNLKNHPVFHTSLLKLYQRDDKRAQQVSKVLLADGKTDGPLVQAVISYRLHVAIKSTRFTGLVNRSVRQRGNPYKTSNRFQD